MAQAAAAVPRQSPPLSAAAAARAIALLLPAGLLLAAFATQYFWHLYPCEMCWWQRYAHMVAFVPAVTAFATPVNSRTSRLLVVLAALGIAVSGAIGVYHAGVELKIFEGFTTCTTTAKGATTAELLRAIVNAPIIRCDQVQWSFLGISMAGWNAIISLGGAALILALSWKASRA